MKYKMIVYTIKSGKGFDYIAEYPALKGVSGVGTSEFEAISDLIANAEVNIAALKEAGLPIPEEDSYIKTEYSGKLSLRLSSSLHKKIAELSEQEGVSINQCIVEAVAEAVAKVKVGQKVEIPNSKTQEAINEIEVLIKRNDPSDRIEKEAIFKDLGFK